MIVGSRGSVVIAAGPHVGPEVHGGRGHQGGGRGRGVLTLKSVQQEFVLGGG